MNKIKGHYCPCFEEILNVVQAISVKPQGCTPMAQIYIIKLMFLFVLARKCLFLICIKVLVINIIK